MKLLAPVLAVLLFIGCGDDDSPTASNPGDELVGTWRRRSGMQPWWFARDGTMSLSLEKVGLSIAIEGEWELVGDKLVVISTVAGESYTIRGDQLMLVDDESGPRVISDEEFQRGKIRADRALQRLRHPQGRFLRGERGS